MNNNNIYGSPPPPKPEFPNDATVKHLESGIVMVVKGYKRALKDDLNWKIISFVCVWKDDDGKDHEGDFLPETLELVSMPD